jgi:hypothetical protein
MTFEKAVHLKHLQDMRDRLIEKIGPFEHLCTVNTKFSLILQYDQMITQLLSNPKE